MADIVRGPHQPGAIEPRPEVFKDFIPELTKAFEEGIGIVASYAPEALMDAVAEEYSTTRQSQSWETVVADISRQTQEAFPNWVLKKPSLDTITRKDWHLDQWKLLEGFSFPPRDPEALVCIVSISNEADFRHVAGDPRSEHEKVTTRVKAGHLVIVRDDIMHCVSLPRDDGERIVGFVGFSFS